MRMNDGAFVKEYEDINMQQDYILQTVVEHVEYVDPRFQVSLLISIPSKLLIVNG
jgi:hypothetical protein